MTLLSGKIFCTCYCFVESRPWRDLFMGTFKNFKFFRSSSFFKSFRSKGSAQAYTYSYTPVSRTSTASNFFVFRSARSRLIEMPLNIICKNSHTIWCSVMRFSDMFCTLVKNAYVCIKNQRMKVSRVCLAFLLLAGLAITSTSCRTSKKHKCHDCPTFSNIKARNFQNNPLYEI